MKKFLRVASVILIAALLFCFFGCPHSNDGSPTNPVNPDSPNTPNTSVTLVSGIFSEGNAFYMNVEADNGPSSGNGAW